MTQPYQLCMCVVWMFLRLGFRDMGKSVHDCRCFSYQIYAAHWVEGRPPDVYSNRDVMIRSPKDGLTSAR